ncbi:uncharacterized protein BO97DRAFT_86280 [Aspergillus homomorphus CBS 101889]|uniref:F-box domain-containing protein n=1 Tax=Aspergillus homomorphus (strain CBS 101889) TaxID=1450537 RepID=A0A395HW96_ASPHC|nr:hypothetical protein BO97DRAFT_86280 [Aspergillus homomorphus CBS 101889]RAL11799.1 hypothetical protein BO97DRAFT_86280 [Aspergillus homomorphus CBS 101889]
MACCCPQSTVERGEALLAYLDQMLLSRARATLELEEVYELLTNIDLLKQDIRDRRWWDETDSGISEDDDFFRRRRRPVRFRGHHDSEGGQESSQGLTHVEVSTQLEDSEEDTGSDDYIQQSVSEGNHGPGQSVAERDGEEDRGPAQNNGPADSDEGTDSDEALEETDSQNDQGSFGTVKHTRFEDEPCTACVILFKLEPHCFALRIRAMELSRPSIRPLTIFDVPNDLLLQIFEYFQDFRVSSKADFWLNSFIPRWQGEDFSPVEVQKHRRTIPSLRLVCRLFNELSSSLLCPILFVNLDQASLDRAIQLSGCPLVAAGFRAVRVGLRFRIRDHEKSLQESASHHQGELED